MPFDDLVARARGQGARAQARAALIEKKRAAAAEDEAPAPKRCKRGTFQSMSMAFENSAKATAMEVVDRFFPGETIFKLDVNSTFDTAFEPSVRESFKTAEFEDVVLDLEPYLTEWPDRASSGKGWTRREVAWFVLNGDLGAFVRGAPTEFSRTYDKYLKHRYPEIDGLRKKADACGTKVKEALMDVVRKISSERRLSRVEDIAEKLENGHDKTSQELRELRCMLQGLLRLLSPEQRAAVLRDLSPASGNPQQD